MKIYIASSFDLIEKIELLAYQLEYRGHQFTFDQMREIGQRYVKPFWLKIKEETKNE